MIHRILAHPAVVPALLLGLCRAAAAEPASPAVRAYPPPYYTGEILPTPRRFVAREEFLPLYDIARRRPLATLVAGRLPAEQTAARDLAARVGVLAGVEGPALKLSADDGRVPAGNVVCLGSPATSRTAARLAARAGLAFLPAPRGEQGYLIRTVRDGSRFLCLAGGGGPMGATFAAMSLLQLLKVEGGRVLLRAVDVDDWPTFELRGACCYSPEEAARLALAKFSTLDMNYGSVGVDAWRDPDARTPPAGWGRYSGAGALQFQVSTENPHAGKRCIRAAIASYYQGFPDRPDTIGAALVLAESGGYSGPNALPAAPGVYRLSFWLRGDVPEATVSVTGWKDKEATPAARVDVPVDGATLRPAAEWQKIECRFTLPEGLTTFAPMLRLAGTRATGYALESGFWVDDASLVREGTTANLLRNGDAEAAGHDYSDRVAALWEWAVPRGLWPVQYVNPLDVSGWETGGKNKIQVSDPAQIEDLARTFRVSLDRGGTWVMLALDDFASRLGGPAPHYVITNEADRAAYKSLGECHGTLARELHRRLKATHPRCRMIICPAYYWNPRGAYREEGEKYLREFGALVPPDVLIVWTGPAVRSRTITPEDVNTFTRLIGRKPYLWDNTIYARHAEPTYVLDPFDSHYPDRFWEMLAGGLHSNGGSDEMYAVGSLVYGDYAWNPEAYDAAKSVEKALRLILGPECAPDAAAFRDHFFAVRDPRPAIARGLGKMSPAQLAKTLGPLTAGEIGEIARHVEAMNAALDRLRASSPNQALVDKLAALAAPLTASLRVLKEHGDLSAHAAVRISGGLMLPEYAFKGGAGHQVYANRCEPRQATWVYGARSSNPAMSAAFLLEHAPAAATLVFEGQSCDKGAAPVVEVLVNGRSLHRGPNPCRTQGWSEWKIEIPAGTLRAGTNEVAVRNLEDSDSANAAWFMVAQAKLLFAEK